MIPMFTQSNSPSLQDVGAGAAALHKKQNEDGGGNKKRPRSEERGLWQIIPAATYVPTQLPVQYHRPGEA